jgi:3-deoxy-7-phosphoheptulonate synthase
MLNNLAQAIAAATPGAGREQEQQPQWTDHPAYGPACETLATAEPLVDFSDVRALHGRLAAVAAGDARILHAGDCAESLYECTPAQVAKKLSVLDQLADSLGKHTDSPVIRVGRIGGQFAKPRSNAEEQYGGRRIPAFRGHLVNSEVPTWSARQHDPRRMLWAYEASKRVLSWMTEYRLAKSGQAPTSRNTEQDLGPWTSHEALITDYEWNLTRTVGGTGEPYLSSTHLPWAGVRTNHPDGIQMRNLAAIRNPIGCKIGPGSDVPHVLRVCAMLDPEREPGRLILIARLGHELVASALPPLVRAVRNAGHPVIWLTDPMHGNTVRTSSGLKTRHLDSIRREAVMFTRILERLRVHPAGLHLEVAASEVTECVGGPVSSEDDVPRAYTSLCDPRLNPEQAQLLLEQWS